MVELISTVAGIFTGLAKGYVEGEQVKAQNTINKANSIAENLMRAANNELGAAQGSLSRYNQSISNQRVASATGDQVNTAIINYRRARDNADAGDFESQISDAEQQGAQAAAGAASGLTGGVVDMVEGTSLLRQSRIRQRVQDQSKQGAYDAAKQQGDILRAGLEQMDTGSVVDNIDYSISTFTPQKRGGNWFGDILGAVAKDPQNTANVANRFSFKSTPKANGSGTTTGWVP